MPRRRWKLKDRREPLSAATRAYLELGLGGVMAMQPRPPGYEDAVFFNGRHALPATWRERGEEITAAWAAEHPGERPWGWWQFDATEPRACLEGAEFVHRGKNPGDGDWIWKQEFGLPGRPQVRRPGAKPARMMFESQAAHLRRRELLLPGELEQVTAEDFEPEVVEIPELAELEFVARRPTAPALASTNGKPRRPAA